MCFPGKCHKSVSVSLMLTCDFVFVGCSAWSEIIKKTLNLDICLPVLSPHNMQKFCNVKLLLKSDKFSLQFLSCHDLV